MNTCMQLLKQINMVMPPVNHSQYPMLAILALIPQATNMLDNPDFDREFDYAPYVEVDKSGQRRWNEPMLGNFAWRHVVHFHSCFI